VKPFTGIVDVIKFVRRLVAAKYDGLEMMLHVGGRLGGGQVAREWSVRIIIDEEKEQSRLRNPTRKAKDQISSTWLGWKRGAQHGSGRITLNPVIILGYTVARRRVSSPSSPAQRISQCPAAIPQGTNSGCQRGVAPFVGAGHVRLLWVAWRPEALELTDVAIYG